MAEKQKYTKEGYQKLVEEYEFLTKVKREEVKKAIAEARSFGDLSENSEYDEARNEQAKVESRIKELEELIQNAEISNDDDFDEDVVGLGSLVKMVVNGREAEYSIVGSNEANPFENKISDMSAIGKSIIGKRAGDETTVQVNAGQVTIKVLEVSRAK
ncbi:MAG: transcription elongation factor GreA [Clostridia bacterium]|nr:transcription elongation factor GreA [Clostridia bacterium]